MVVHSHEPRNHRVTRAVHLLRALRGLHRRRRPDGLYLAVRDHHGLVFFRRRARSINHAHVIQHEHRRIHADDLRNIRRHRRLRRRDRSYH